MTPGTRLAVAAAASLALHWAALAPWGAEEAPPGAADAPPAVRLTGAEAGLSLAAPLTLEPAAPQPNAAADTRRAALAAYLDALAEAVHARRAAPAGLAGNAAVALEVDAAGRFSAVALRRGSGDPVLDADALDAVRAASGAVPRPRALGGGPLAVVLVVKYQFGL